MVKSNVMFIIIITIIVPALCMHGHAFSTKEHVAILCVAVVLVITVAIVTLKPVITLMPDQQDIYGIRKK